MKADIGFSYLRLSDEDINKMCYENFYDKYKSKIVLGD